MHSLIVIRGDKMFLVKKILRPVYTGKAIFVAQLNAVFVAL